MEDLGFGRATTTLYQVVLDVIDSSLVSLGEQQRAKLVTVVRYLDITTDAELNERSQVK